MGGVGGVGCGGGRRREGREEEEVQAAKSCKDARPGQSDQEEDCHRPAFEERPEGGTKAGVGGGEETRESPSIGGGEDEDDEMR